MCLNVYSFWIAEVKITVREKKLWLSLGIWPSVPGCPGWAKFIGILQCDY
jgi:hypothetical protein